MTSGNYPGGVPFGVSLFIDDDTDVPQKHIIIVPGPDPDAQDSDRMLVAVHASNYQPSAEGAVEVIELLEDAARGLRAHLTGAAATAGTSGPKTSRKFNPQPRSAQ